MEEKSNIIEGNDSLNESKLNIKKLIIVGKFIIGFSLLILGGVLYLIVTNNNQFENSGKYVANNRIDTLVMKTFRSKGIEPANLCSDAVFIRRVYLDVIGTLPEPQEVREFLQDRSPRKRAALRRDERIEGR